MKRKIVLYIAVSLDGFIAEKGGSVGFLSEYENKKEDYGFKRFYDSVDTIILGNTTYKQALSFGETYKGKECFVFSRKKQSSSKCNVTFVKGNIKDFIKKIRLGKNKKAWLVGGADLAHQFLENDLIDELIISIIPKIIGEGIPLFSESKIRIKLKLVDVKKYKSGIVQISYKK